MISWGTIVYGAALTFAVVAVVTWALTRHGATALVSGLASGGGALAWNAILHSANGEGFFVDARIDFLPASWQDTMSGVAAIAATSLVWVWVPSGADRRATWRLSASWRASRCLPWTSTSTRSRLSRRPFVEAAR